MNNKLGFTTEEELKEIAELGNDVAGGTIEAATAIVSAVLAASWILCPSGACTSTGYCK